VTEPLRDDDLIAVGKRLLEIRLAWGYPNAREWSRFTGINHTTWKNWEVGERLPSLQEALVLCAKTGISLDWIYRGLEHANPLHVVQHRGLEGAVGLDTMAKINAVPDADSLSPARSKSER
jgi:hypothetical protein